MSKHDTKDKFERDLEQNKKGSRRNVAHDLPDHEPSSLAVNYAKQRGRRPDRDELAKGPFDSVGGRK